MHKYENIKTCKSRNREQYGGSVDNMGKILGVMGRHRKQLKMDLREMQCKLFWTEPCN